MTVTVATHTLEELARTVNRVIENHPNRQNPTSGSVCVYHKTDTDERCLIGQALYDLTGKNVPAKFENENIETLLGFSEFCEFFGLDYRPESWIVSEIGTAQNVADGNYQWGSIEPINIPA